MTFVARVMPKGCMCVFAVQLGVQLPEPQQGRLVDLEPSSDGTRAVAALQVRLISGGGGALCYKRILPPLNGTLHTR
jgi:hypothetical protein